MPPRFCVILAGRKFKISARFCKIIHHIKLSERFWLGGLLIPLMFHFESILIVLSLKAFFSLPSDLDLRWRLCLSNIFSSGCNETLSIF